MDLIETLRSSEGKTLEFKQDFSPCEKFALGRKSPSDATIRRHSESDVAERACDTDSFDSSSAFDAFCGPVGLSLLGGLPLTLLQRSMMFDVDVEIAGLPQPQPNCTVFVR